MEKQVKSQDDQANVYPTRDWTLRVYANLLNTHKASIDEVLATLKALEYRVTNLEVVIGYIDEFNRSVVNIEVEGEVIKLNGLIKQLLDVQQHLIKTDALIRQTHLNVKPLIDYAERELIAERITDSLNNTLEP